LNASINNIELHSPLRIKLIKLDTVIAAVLTTVLATDNVVPQADTGVAATASSCVKSIDDIKVFF
jgi:hypothetical protein